MDWSLDNWILVLRLVLVFILYAFLYQVAVSIYRSLRSEDTASEVKPTMKRPAGSLLSALRERGANLRPIGPIGSLLVVESAVPTVPVGTTFTLTGTTRLGRSDRATVQLPDTLVSNEHAVIEHRDGRLLLRDLGSTNGTRLNGESVTDVVALAPGDSIQIGSVRMVFRTEVAEPAVP